MIYLKERQKSKTKKIFNKGFTLIELLLALTIVIMLTAFAFSYLGQARMKARDARRQTDFKEINLAMELCYNDPACAGIYRYPTTVAGPDTITQVDTDGSPVYIVVPKDLRNTAPHQYTWTANESPFQYYCLYVKMEVENDTYLCASNKGLFQKTESGYVPSNSDCCGVNAMN